MNGLKKLYTGSKGSIRTALLEDLRERGITRQRFYHWVNKQDADFMEMPTILKQIVCKNIPEAEELFKLPEVKSTSKV